MSGETEEHVSGWTTDTLRAHVVAILNERDRRYQQRFDAQEQAMSAALTAAKEAVDKAEAAIGERLTLLNEFRAQSKDEQGKFITRQEAEAATTRNTERIQELITTVQGCLTRTEMTVAEERYSERLQVLETRQNLNDGKSAGLSTGWTIFVALATIVIAALATYAALRSGK